MKILKWSTLALTLLLACGILAACGGQQAASGDAFAEQIGEKYPELKGRPFTVDKVARVVDGDTFETASKQKVRMIGVNTPETVKPNSPVEYFGKEASNFTKSKLNGQEVYLFADVEDKDKYGRALRYVFIRGQQIMFNETLVAEGYADTMTIPPNVMFAQRFVEAVRHAREQNKGLWGSAEGQTKDAAQPDSASCAQPQIKGNINAKNEKIYHVPGGAMYDKTVPEQWFCTEDEAIKAGFRKSKI